MATPLQASNFSLQNVDGSPVTATEVASYQSFLNSVANDSQATAVLLRQEQGGDSQTTIVFDNSTDNGLYQGNGLGHFGGTVT